MSATGYLDVCGFVAASSGAGDFVVSVALTGYQTPASAGAVNGTVYSYRAESTDKTQWEIGFGAYTTAGTTLARTTVAASSTGSKVSFTATPNVYITALSADLQNAAMLTSGTLPVARLNGGTANQMPQGDGSWVTQSRKLLNTLTASSSANLADTTSLTSTFQSYEIAWEDVIPATNNDTLVLRVRVGGTFQTSGYSGQTFVTNGTGILTNSWSSYAPLCNTNSAGSNTPGCNGSVRLVNPSASSIHAIYGEGVYAVGAGGVGCCVMGGTYNTIGVLDGIQFSFASGGAIASGRVKIYGLN